LGSGLQSSLCPFPKDQEITDMVSCRTALFSGGYQI
jgi:hypothetical protein